MNAEHPSGHPSTTGPAGYRPGQHQAPAGWQPPAPASPLRIASGVLALITAVIGLFIAGAFLFSKSSAGGSTPFNGWMNFFLIVGSIGCLVTGIVIMVKQRKRGGATPWLLASFAAFIVIACLGFMSSPTFNFPGAPIITLPVALTTLLLTVLVIMKGKPGR